MRPYRFMFLAFTINNATLVIERQAMDGSQNYKKILLNTRMRTGGINYKNMVLHYARNTDILFIASEWSDTIGSFEESTGKRLNTKLLLLSEMSKILHKKKLKSIFCLLFEK